MEIKGLEGYLGVEIIDEFPKFSEFNLSVDEVIGVAGFTTVSSRDLKEKIKKYVEENKLEEKVRELHRESTRRGHASVSTTPHIAINIKASRISDLFFTSYPFGSYLVMSQRYVSKLVALYPLGLDEKYKEIFRREYENQYKTYNELVSKYNIKREVARRVLGLGFNSHMFLIYPVDSINHIRKFIELNNPYIPKEILAIVEKIVENVKYSKELLNQNFNAPHYNVSYPNPFYRYNKIEIFKNLGDEVNIRWENLDYIGIIDVFLEEFENLKKNPPKNWEEYRKYSIKLGYIASLYPNEYIVSLNFPCSLACFNELKRHRTVSILVESIYDVLLDSIKNLDKRIYFPKVILEKEYLYRIYYDSILSSISTIENLINDLDLRDLVYLLPQAIIIKTIIKLDLKNLISPFLFYRIRSCLYAEEEIREKVRKIPYILLNNSKYKDYVEKLFKVMVSEFNDKFIPISKCIAGICPERNYCEAIFGIRRDYNRELHKKLQKLQE